MAAEEDTQSVRNAGVGIPMESKNVSKYHDTGEYATEGSGRY